MSTPTTAPAGSSASSGGAAVSLRSLLEEMIERDASDLHITAGERAKLRVDGDIVNSNIETVLSPKDTLQLAYSVLPRKRARFWMPKEKSSSSSISNRFFWFSVSTEYASCSVSLGDRLSLIHISEPTRLL